jgi:hypothetical protein
MADQNCANGLPYDVNGNPCPNYAACSDVTDPNFGVGPCGAAGGGAYTGASSPIALQASSPSGGIFTSILNFGGKIIPAIASVAAPTTTTGLRLQINPATGQQQYFNPATGQYVGGAVNTSGSLLGGNNGFLLVIAALVVAFFMFGGKKRLAAA